MPGSRGRAAAPTRRGTHDRWGACAGAATAAGRSPRTSVAAATVGLKVQRRGVFPASSSGCQGSPFLLSAKANAAPRSPARPKAGRNVGRMLAGRREWSGEPCRNRTRVRNHGDERNAPCCPGGQASRSPPSPRRYCRRLSRTCNSAAGTPSSGQKTRTLRGLGTSNDRCGGSMTCLSSSNV